MQRYHCNGWLHITIMHADRKTVRIRMNHDQVHPPPENNPFVRDGRGRFVSSNMEVARATHPQRDGNSSGIETILDIPVNVQKLQVGTQGQSQVQDDPPEPTISTPSDTGQMMDNDDGHATIVSNSTASVSYQAQAQSKQRQPNGLVHSQTMNGTQPTINPTSSTLNGATSMNGIGVSHSMAPQPQPLPSPSMQHSSHNVQPQTHTVAPQSQPPPPPPPPGVPPGGTHHVTLPGRWIATMKLRY